MYTHIDAILTRVQPADCFPSSFDDKTSVSIEQYWKNPLTNLKNSNRLQHQSFDCSEGWTPPFLYSMIMFALQRFERRNETSTHPTARKKKTHPRLAREPQTCVIYLTILARKHKTTSHTSDHQRV